MFHKWFIYNDNITWNLDVYENEVFGYSKIFDFAYVQKSPSNKWNFVAMKIH